MANRAHVHATPRLRNGEPQPAPPPNSEPATAKRDLASWWKQFSKRANVKKEEEKEPEPRGIFGVPLIQSIPYANVAISLFNEHGESYIYGYVPIVVAKCGVFLKEKATDVEGIFRLAGSEKRIKELKIAFDTPPRWGKGLDWTGYTVHDAANILRRYFNQLPEPIIPLVHYDAFREPLRGHQAEAVGPIEGQAPSVGGFDPDAAVRIYQHQIKELPSLNRQLLLYILDLLAVFAAKSDVNKMTTSNLAAIFQPGILSHPQHDMSPQDYRLSQDVLIFLIDNQDHFLIGMEGTAVDEGTLKHVESGPTTPQAKTPTTPGKNKSGIGRSASTSSSAGAESIRKLGGVRRNVSTSSRQSRHSGAMPSPGTPTTSGVHRSNTLPSKKSPALPSTRFPREKQSDPPTPAGEEVKTQRTSTEVKNVSNNIVPEGPVPKLPVTEKIDVVKHQPVQQAQPAQLAPVPSQLMPSEIVSPPSQEVTPTSTSPTAAPIPVSNMLSVDVSTPLPSPGRRTPQRTPLVTPIRDKSEFIEASLDDMTPTSTGEPAPAVRTFTQILGKMSPSGDEKKDGRKPNKLQKKSRLPSSTNPSAHSSTHSLSGPHVAVDIPTSPLPIPSSLGGFQVNSSKEALSAFNQEAVSSRNSGATLKPTMSPSASFKSHSTATEYSELEPADDSHAPKEEKKEKGFWKSHRRGESKATPTASQTDLGQMALADKSMSSFSSGSGWGRRSLQIDSHPGSDSSGLPVGGDSKEQEKRGPLAWFSEKRRERKEREAEKQRAKSPPGLSSDAGRKLAPSNEELPVRGKSMDVLRMPTNEGSSDVTPTGPSPPPAVSTTTTDASKPAA